MQEILALQGLFRFIVWSAMAALEPWSFLHTGEVQGSIPCAPTIIPFTKIRSEASRLKQSRRAVAIARSIRQVPQAKYLVGLGAALRRLGRLEEALKACDKALLFTPEDALIWTNMGHVLRQAERYEEICAQLSARVEA